jgi:hypothetical protein
MPSQLHFVGDTRALTVDESPAEVEAEFAPGRLGSTKTVARLQYGGKPVYVNPSTVTFFTEESPSPARDEPLSDGPGFGLP